MSIGCCRSALRRASCTPKRRGSRAAAVGALFMHSSPGRSGSRLIGFCDSLSRASGGRDFCCFGHWVVHTENI